MTQPETRAPESYYQLLARAERQQNRYLQITLGIVLATMIVTVLGAFAQRQQILDCVNPGGECYERNAQHMQDAVTQITSNQEKIMDNQREMKDLIRDLRKDVSDGTAQ